MHEVWSEHVASGEAYAAQAFQGAVVGMVPHVQLLNPVASGVRIRLRCLEPMGVLGVAVNTNVRRINTPLTTLGPLGIVENLLGGGDPSVAEIRAQASALVGSGGWLILTGANVRTDYPVENQDWGVDLLPGEGAAANGTTGLSLLMGFMWVEVPV